MPFASRTLSATACLALLVAAACGGGSRNPASPSGPSPLGGATIAGIVNGVEGSSVTERAQAGSSASATGLTVTIVGKGLTATVDGFGLLPDCQRAVR